MLSWAHMAENSECHLAGAWKIPRKTAAGANWVRHVVYADCHL